MGMKYVYSAAALLAATAYAQDGQSCSNAILFAGNYYCSQVDAITYTSVGGSGSYNQVTNMDSGSGQCSSSPFPYSGSLSPLDEEVSLHMRGPFQLLQFAAYSPGSSSSKKARREQHAKRHAHQHAHAHLHERQIGSEVIATINGVVQSWANEYTGASPTGAVGGAAQSAAPAANQFATAAAGTLASAVPQASAIAGVSGWTRQAYYEAESATSDGLVFLNHYGGTGSGVFDYTFGNSLSYASADGTTGASSSQILANTTLPSDSEVIIMTDNQCGAENTDCGYYRPETVAYHGFAGASKAFFFEFSMPSDGQTSDNIYVPVNMPALWMLNAQIPRTLQYGQADCSCWTSGCGEFDIFEVLTSGYNKAKSTLHGNIAGGSSYWFERPMTSSMKLGVVMYNNNIHIKVLDAATDFGETTASSIISEIVESTLADSATTSLFSLVGAGSG